VRRSRLVRGGVLAAATALFAGGAAAATTHAEMNAGEQGATATTTASPSSGSVSVDWTAFGHSTTNVSVTSEATNAGTLLVLFAATDSSSGPNSLTAVSGGGLDWTFVGGDNAQQGDSEIWDAIEPAAQAAFTVTGTEAQPNLAAQTSLVELSSPSGNPAVAAYAGGSGGDGAPEVTVSAAAWQAAVGNEFCGAEAPTASPGQTILDNYDPNFAGTAVDAFWLQTSPTGSISDTAPTDQCWNMEAVSVIAPSSGGGGTTTTTVPATTTTIPPTTTTTTNSTTTTTTTTTTVPSGSTPPFATSVSASHTSLVDQYGNPFLVNGDSAWNLAWGLDSTDQATYLADRRADGFNTVVTDLVGNSANFGGSNGANYNGDLPFTGGNFATPNPAYWSKIDTFFELAKTDGITVFALPVDAYATESANVFSTMTNAQANAFGQWLANRYPPSQYPGIVWMLGNDYAGDGVGCCNEGFLSQYQALVSGLGTARPVTIEQGFDESLSTDGPTLGPLMTLNTAYSYHPSYEVIERGRSTEKIPVVFFEGAYENAVTGFPSTPLDLRKQLGWSMTSGGAGTFYGNDYLWAFQPGWQSQLDTSDVAQRHAFNAAFAGVNWQNLQPDVDNQLVVSGRNSEYTAWSTSNTPETNDPTYGNYVSAAYSADGTLGVIYNPDTSENRITISASVLGADPSITAVDPTDGARTSLGWTTTPTMGANAGGDHDWLFIITAAPSS
jgi:hypothetical protein